MKNWVILVFVALFGVLLGLHQLNRKNVPAGGKPQPSREQAPEDVGVPMPQTDDLSVPDLVQTLPEAKQAPASVPPRYSEEPSACKDATIKDIMEAHGKTWGNSVKLPSNIADPGISNQIYEAMEQYLSCKAAGQGDFSPCNFLPTSNTRTDFRLRCIQDANKVLLSAYMLGKNKNPAICDAFLNNTLRGAQVNRSAFCDAAAKGPESLCAQSVFSGKKKCPIPSNREACGRRPNLDQDCVDGFSSYEALKAGQITLCRGKQYQHCRAYMTKDLSHCAELALSASMSYCALRDMIADSEKKVAMPKMVQDGE